MHNRTPKASAIGNNFVTAIVYPVGIDLAN